MKKLQERNLVLALQLKLIDWFQYLELCRQIKDVDND